MKKFVLLSALVAIIGTGTRLHAQCSASNLSVIIKGVTSSSSGCQVTLDLAFTGDFNNGNKFAFIHLWESAPVNNYPNLSYLTPPTAADLAAAVATIVIVDPGKSSAALYGQYPPNTSVPVSYSGISFSKSGTTYTLSNVVINLSTCSQPVTIKGDVWASQSSDGQVAHCFNTGTITLLLNNPVVSGFKQCVSPRLVNLFFSNGHATLDETVTTSVYIDVNKNNIVDAGDIDITSVLSPALPATINLAANSSQSFMNVAYPPYSAQRMYDNMPLIVKATATAPGAASVTITKSGINFLGTCSSLPVTFQSFTATRNRSAVALKWETSSEQNNSGFAVERNINGSWQQVTFIPSQAASGNSNSVLGYQYTDQNPLKGITQYRIRQVDKDGSSSYSEIRTVRGEGQPGNTIIYPNPSSNGKVNISFGQTPGTRDVSLTDMAGRITKQWNSISADNIEINNLAPGIYSLRVILRETGEQAAYKIIVNNR